MQPETDAINVVQFQKNISNILSCGSITFLLLSLEKSTQNLEQLTCEQLVRN